MNVQQNSTSYSTFTDWFSANIEDEECEHLCKMGADYAAPTKIKNKSQTIPLYNEFANDIWDIVFQDGITIKNIPESHLQSATSFAHFMVWYAVEVLALQR